MLRLKQLEFAFFYHQELRKYFVFVFTSIVVPLVVESAVVLLFKSFCHRIRLRHKL